MKKFKYDLNTRKYPRTQFEKLDEEGQPSGNFVPCLASEVGLNRVFEQVGCKGLREFVLVHIEQCSRGRGIVGADQEEDA